MCFDFFKGMFQDMAASIKHINKETIGVMSRPIYKQKFFKHLSSFENFKEFIQYPNIKGKHELCFFQNLEKKDDVCLNTKNEKIACSFPCMYNFQYKNLYKNIALDELCQIYTDIKNTYQYDNTKQIIYGRVGNRPRESTVTGKSQYIRNCLAVYDIVLSKTKKIYMKKVQIELKKQREEEQIKK